MFISLPLIILFFALGAQIILRSFGFWDEKRKIIFFRWFFFISILIILISQSYDTWREYNLWLKGMVSKLLLPPYQDISYFAFYSLTRFFEPYLISLVAALAFLLSAKFLNQRHNEKFFYPEEIWLGATAIFSTSHPGWIVYCISIILIYLLFHLLSLLFSRFSLERLSLYYLWLPTAIFIIIIINYWFTKMNWWGILKI